MYIIILIVYTQHSDNNILSGAHKGKEHATHVYVWVQYKYKTLVLMVSIFGNWTLILTLHDSS